MVKKLMSCMVVAAVFVSGCASHTVINTVPQQAKVYLDERFLGESPVSHSDTAIAGSKRELVLKKEGYKNKTATIRKEKVAVGPIIGGIFFLFPFLWTLGYPESYTFELEPENK